MDLEAGISDRSSNGSTPINPATETVPNYQAATNKGLAEFMSKDPDLWIFRHFSQLNLVNIIHLQQQLVELERQLAEAVPKGIDGFNKSEYDRLMPLIELTLKKYDDAIDAQARRKAFRMPGEEAILCLKQYCANAGLDKSFQLSLDGNEKYISVAAEEKGWIHRLVVAYKFLRVKYAPSAVFKIANSEKNASLPMVLVFPESTVRRTEKTIINIGFCFLLLCPIFALTYIDNKALKVSIVLMFIVALSTLTIDLANSTSTTNVALLAGYSAILVVFLTGNTNA